MFSGCTQEQFFEKKTVDVGDDVKLTCERKATGTLFWIRLVPGNFPEILAKTNSFETVHTHITATKEPGTFVLHIRNVKLSDTAFYICIKTQQQSVLFLKGTDLRVEGKIMKILFKTGSFLSHHFPTCKYNVDMCLHHPYKVRNNPLFHKLCSFFCMKK